jgi:hypothetical protein
VYQLSLDPVAEEQIKAVSQEALRPLAELFTLRPWTCRDEARADVIRFRLERHRNP